MDILLTIIGLFIFLPTMAQQTFYVYRNDGVINQFIIEDILSVEFSKIGVDGLESDDYVTQEIHTIDSISRIPLALVDSVSFMTPDPIKSISESYVHIDWSKTQLLSCDSNTGDFAFYCSGSDPNIKEESVIVIETDTVSYIVLVTDVRKKDNIYNVKGVLGDISNLFFDTEFTLSTDVMNAASLSRFYNPARMARKNNVEFEDDGIVRATGILWKKEKEHVKDLYKKGNAHIYTKSKMGLNMDYEVTLRFGDKEAIEISGKKFFVAKNLHVDANIKGTMDASYDFYVDIEKDTVFDLAPNEKDKYVLLKHKLFPTIPIKIPVGPIMIPIDLGVDLFADVSLKGGGEFHFTTGVGAKATTLIGTRYDEKKNKNELYNEKPKLTIASHDPTVSGKGYVSGKLHIFPRIHAWIYGLAGPSFDIKPFIQADLSGGYQKNLLKNAPSDYCAWSLETFGGLDIAVGLSRSSWNYEVWNKSTKDKTVFKYSLYKSPVEIELLSASPDEIKRGKESEVKFKVFDKGFDGKEVVTPLPQLVKFEGKGEIKATVGQYGIVNSGIATALWTPTSSSDTLFARMYNINGGVIAEALYFKNNITSTPIATTGEYSKVTKNSATVSCTYENVPEDGICGVKYKWKDGSAKQNTKSSDGTHDITLSGLASGTTYTYRAYIEANGQTYYGEEKTFTTEVELPDLSGEWKCTIYKDDGSVLDKPTLILTADHKVTQKESNFTSEEHVGSWNINTKGSVTIGFSWVGGSWSHPVYYDESFSGIVNSISSPSTIEGTVRRAWASISENGHTYKFVMTR